MAAAAVYVAVGVFMPEVLFSSVVGIAYLLAAVWLLPAAVRRLQ